MIKGSIKVHEEPAHYQTGTYRGTLGDDDDTDWSGGYFGYHMTGNQFYSGKTYSQRETELADILVDAAGKGIVLDARVSHARGFRKEFGTIIQIHRSPAVAWNYSCGKLEPFKVRWDPIPGDTREHSGIFDYELSELSPVSDTTQQDISVSKHMEGLTP